ncbi:ribonuclease H-like domain-containing protein [Paenibacillus oenotherae]|uniref:Ribonuclease H-like domain-containing protein n=1 Tax=Paenibacillus oenotherae TaxID=1435645 RepID=A0ABS7DCE7_9BACL|nr:ribonuclease H-like domain-containing protein [Paenibacillus oenotherae]MBW7477607.1 ribonuclease H-like domain-containing protein [Paenibacillus oenotherae]
MSRLRDRLLRHRASAEEVMEEPSADTASPVDADAASVEGMEEAEHETLSPLWEGLDVQLTDTANGSFLRREAKYPLSYQHGLHRLEELRASVKGLAAFRAVSAVERNRTIRQEQFDAANRTPLDPEKVLFLDLETTGLGVGTGNVPFMVGIAYMSGEAFIVEQMLIRHPAEERAMLTYLCGKLPGFTHLVTYNGRTFDWPLLLNRLILNGFRKFTWEPLHIDLLHPSRSVWRNTLVSCRLSHVEEERLGITRDDDVPGSLAPAIYFQFLADHNPQPLLGVFRHNETDMLSLACLAIRFGHLLAGQLGAYVQQRPESEELLRTGLWLEKMGAMLLAEPIFAQLADDGSASPACLLMLAERDKKCGNWTRAVLLWQKVVHAAESSLWPDWKAHIELSMYYEHKTKQIQSALSLAETALSLAQKRYLGLRLDAKRREELEGIRKRIDRLRVKIGRLSG